MYLSGGRVNFVIHSISEVCVVTHSHPEYTSYAFFIVQAIIALASPFHIELTHSYYFQILRLSLLNDLGKISSGIKCNQSSFS